MQPQFNQSNGIGVLIIADPVFESGLLGAAFSASIITLYVTVVLAVGRFLRAMMQDQVMRIMYQELHDVTELLILCEGIFIARITKEFEREEILYRRLIRIYRSPELLIKLSKRRDKLKLN